MALQRANKSCVCWGAYRATAWGFTCVVVSAPFNSFIHYFHSAIELPPNNTAFPFFAGLHSFPFRLVCLSLFALSRGAPWPATAHNRASKLSKRPNQTTFQFIPAPFIPSINQPLLSWVDWLNWNDWLSWAVFLRFVEFASSSNAAKGPQCPSTLFPSIILPIRKRRMKKERSWMGGGRLISSISFNNSFNSFSNCLSNR